MIRQFTGLLLALLIANPFCCCLGSALGNDDGAHAEAPAAKHACCTREAPPTQDSGEGENESPCDCDQKGHSPALLSESLAGLKAPNLVPIPLFEGLTSHLVATFEHLGKASRSYTDSSAYLPELRGGPSPGRVHAIVHGVFLI